MLHQPKCHSSPVTIQSKLLHYNVKQPIITGMADGGVMMGLSCAEALELAAQLAYPIFLWKFQSGSLREHHSMQADGAPRRHTLHN